MNKLASLKSNVGVALLLPVVTLIAACGGGISPGNTSATLPSTDVQAAEVQAVSRPTDYAPDTASILNSDLAAADGAISSAYTTSSQGVASSVPVQSENSLGILGQQLPSADGSKSNNVVTSAPTTSSAIEPTQLLAMVGTSAVSSRNPLIQPFASTSIWNMPIGAGASYAAANLSGNPGKNIWAKMPGVDDEKIVLTPTAPMTTVGISNAGWTGKNRCAATGGTMTTVPMPSTYVVPNTNTNSSASFLLSDKRTIVQFQPLARCTAGGTATAMAKFTNVDLYGPGITGAHGGSGLSAIGGSVRLGELRPGQATGPAHALKVNVYAKEALYKCSTRSACFRWPAVTSDSYAVGWYGAANGNTNSAMKMGALLAIPYSTSIASLSLETLPAKQLAWTLQNYGAYIVDDTYAPGFDINVEDGPNGSMRKQFKADWGFEMEQRVQGNTPWIRDIQKIVKSLYVVNNNSSTTIGGGGTPRQAMAPAIAP